MKNLNQIMQLSCLNFPNGLPFSLKIKFKFLFIRMWPLCCGPRPTLSSCLLFATPFTYFRHTSFDATHQKLSRNSISKSLFLLSSFPNMSLPPKYLHGTSLLWFLSYSDITYSDRPYWEYYLQSLGPSHSLCIVYILVFHSNFWNYVTNLFTYISGYFLL